MSFTFNGVIFSDLYAQDAINFSGKLDANSPKLNVDNSPYAIHNLSASIGERLVISAKGNGFKPSLNVGKITNGGVCPDCVISKTNGDTAIARFIPAQNGVVNIRINSPSGYENGTYDVDVKRYKIKPLAAQSLKLDTIVAGTISDDEVANNGGIAFDLYQIDLKAGEIIRVELLSQYFDPKLELFLLRKGHEGKEAFVRDDDGGVGTNARIIYKAPKAGRYYIEVSPNDAYKIGAYSLEVSTKNITQHRPPLKSIKLNPSKTSVEADVIINPKKDYAEEYGDKFIASDFLFHAEKGKAYWLEASSDEIDVIAAIGKYNAQGIFDLVQSDDDNGGGKNAKFRFYATKPEDYIIRIRAHEADFDKAKINLKIYEAEQANAPKTAKPLKLSEATLVTLEDGGARQEDGTLYDIYAINLSQGEKVTIETTDFEDNKSDTYLSIGSGQPNEFKPLDNQGDKLITEDDDSGIGLNARINFTAPFSGEYLIKVATTNSARDGKFYLLAKPKLDNQQLSAPVIINSNQVIEGELTMQSPTFGAAEKPFKDYVFDAKTGTSYIIYQSSEDFDSYLYVRPIDDLTTNNLDAKYIENDDAKDENIATPFDAIVKYTADKDGKILIRASAANNDKYGKFKLGIKTINK